MKDSQCARILFRVKVQDRLLDFKKENFEGKRRDFSALGWQKLTGEQSESEKWAIFREQMCSGLTVSNGLERYGLGCISLIIQIQVTS